MEFRCVGVKSVEITKEHQKRRQSSGTSTDAEARKRGEQTGLDTLVVHAVNDECTSRRGPSVFPAVQLTH